MNKKPYPSTERPQRAAQSSEKPQRGGQSYDKPQRDGQAQRRPQGRRPDRPDRPERPDEFDKSAGTLTQALIDLDLGLMKTLAQRARLVSKLRAGKERASTPRSIQDEKLVRTAWEKNALSFSKDPLFSRDLFNLLQEVKLISKEEADASESFSLAPANRPLQAVITGPPSSFAATLWLTLAASLGQPVFLNPLYMTHDMTSLAATLLRCQTAIISTPIGFGMGSVAIEGGKPAKLQGETLHVGDSLLALYLFAFLAAGDVGITRITGDAGLKHVDLAGLRALLPLLGTRLAHLVPHTRGLPVSIESSGMLPEHVVVPAELPMEGICALLVAAIIWNKTITFDFSGVSAAPATDALVRVAPLIQQCQANIVRDGACVTVHATAVSVPARPAVPLDGALAGYQLAMPAFAGGSCSLKGLWPSHESEGFDVAALLQWAGVTLESDEQMVTAALQGDPFITPLHGFDAEGALFPLYVALTVKAQALAHGPLTLPSPISADRLPLANELYSRVGLVSDGTTLSALSGAEPGGREQAVPWTCPDAFWGMALTLAAFVRPGLKLVNPRAVTAAIPAFWSIINSLPTPSDPVTINTKEKENADAGAPRRRFIAAD